MRAVRSGDFQPSLLDGLDAPEGIALGGLGDSVTRTELGAGTWVDVRRGWAAGADELFALLHAQVSWSGEQRWMYGQLFDVPRLHCYLDSPQDLPHPVLLDAWRMLNEHYADDPAGPFTSADLALYRDGADTVPWHADPFVTPTPTDSRVGLLVLGPARPFLLRPRGGGPVLRHLLGHGDLIVLGGSCQSTFEHSVPRTARAAGPRIAVQMRTAQLMDGPTWARGAARILPAEP